LAKIRWGSLCAPLNPLAAINGGLLKRGRRRGKNGIEKSLLIRGGRKGREGKGIPPEVNKHWWTRIQLGVHRNPHGGN